MDAVDQPLTRDDARAKSFAAAKRRGADDDDASREAQKSVRLLFAPPTRPAATPATLKRAARPMPAPVRARSREQRDSSATPANGASDSAGDGEDGEPPSSGPAPQQRAAGNLDAELTLRELARRVGISRRQLREAVNDLDPARRLRARRPGLRWVFVRWADYLAWREAQAIEPEPVAASAIDWARGRVAAEAAL